MTDPHLLIRLDAIVGLLGLLAVLVAIQVVIVDPDVGLPAVLLVGVGGGFTAYWYRQVYTEALT